MKQHILSNLVFANVSNSVCVFATSAVDENDKGAVLGALSSMPELTSRYEKAYVTTIPDGETIPNVKDNLAKVVLPLIMQKALMGDEDIMEAFQIPKEAVTRLNHNRTVMTLHDKTQLWTKGGMLEMPVAVPGGEMAIHYRASNYYVTVTTNAEGSENVEEFRVKRQADVLGKFAALALARFGEQPIDSVDINVAHVIASVCMTESNDIPEVLEDTPVIEGAQNPSPESFARTAVLTQQTAEKTNALSAKTEPKVELEEGTSVFYPNSILRLINHYGLVYVGSGMIGNCYTGEVCSPEKVEGVGLAYRIHKHFGVDGNDLVIPYDILQDGIHSRNNYEVATHQQHMRIAGHNDLDFSFNGKLLREMVWWIRD